MAKITNEQFLNMYNVQQGLSGERPEDIETAPKELDQPDFWRKTQALGERGSELIGIHEPLGPIEDPTYDVASEIPTKYLQQADRYLQADSLSDVNWITYQLDRELENQKIVQDMGWLGAAGEAGTGLISPTTFIAGAGIVKGATKLSTVGKSVLAGSAVAGGTIGIQEYILQQQQSFRPIEESVGTILGATLLGGIIGGGASTFLGRTEKEIISSQIGKIVTDQDLKVITNEAGEVIAAEGSSVGAKQVEYLAALREEGLSNISEGAVKVLSMSGLGLAGPNMLSKLSKSVSTRRLGNNFFDNAGLTLNKGVVDDSADIAINQYNTMLAKISRDIEKTDLVEWKKLGGDYESLSREVTNAQLSGKTTNKIVQKVLDKLKPEQIRLAKALQDRGKLPKNLTEKEMIDYVTIRWDSPKVITNRASVLSRITDDFTVNVERQLSEHGINAKIKADTDIEELINSRISELKAKGAPEESITKLKKLKKEVPLDKESIGSAAQDTVKKLAGEDFSGIDYMQSNAGANFTKERVLTVDYSKYTDVINMDGIGNLMNYLYKANRMVELDDMFKRAGFDGPDDFIKAVQDDVVELSKIDPKVAKNIDKILEKEKQLAKDIVDIATGNILHRTRADKALRYARKYQTLTLLGGVTVSSLPDLAMPIFKHGLGNTIRDGYLPLIRSMKTARKARAELEDMDVAAEMLTNSIYKQLSEDDFSFNASKTKGEQKVDTVMDFFGKATGITFWNNFHQGMAGQMSIARTIRALKSGKMSKKELGRLESLGLDKSTREKILANFNEFGEEYKGSYISNHEQWDAATKRKFGQAVYRDVHSTILRPSSGDIPLVMQKYETAKTILQFKSFVSAATNKILISGLQRRDAQALQGFISLVMMGALTHNIKRMLRGDEPELDPYTVMKEGSARSGVFGWLGEAALFSPFVNSTRYSGMSRAQQTVGPSVSHAWDVLNIGASLAREGELTKQDERTLRRSMPFNNLFYFRALIDQVFDEND